MFVYRLCLALGILHPDELLDSLDWRQIEDWKHFYACEPWGEERADLRLENQRLIAAGATYETGAPPEAVWPYYQPEKHSITEMLRLMKERKHGNHGRHSQS